MKNLMIVICLGFFGLSAQAQFVNGEDLRINGKKYIEISAAQKLASNVIEVDVEHGQEERSFNRDDTRLVNRDGNPLRFYSMVGALNYFDDIGFELKESRVDLNSGNSRTFYILERKDEDDID